MRAFRLNIPKTTCKLLFSAALCTLLCTTLLSQPATAAPADIPIPPAVKQKLVTLTENRLLTLAANLQFTKERKNIQKIEGKWCATYNNFDPDSVRYLIKPMKGKPGEFIAAVKYASLTFCSIADTQKQALDGPFDLQKRSWRTEILKYTNGKWN